MDAHPAGVGHLGLTVRVPVGVVAAITPFNFPLNLVAHKVGPALAAGNAVLIKPAGDTPLTALKLVEVLLEAGLPPQAIACVTGPGSELGQAICTDRRVRKISFTGSYEVGQAICRMAGVKRVTMELGSNSPVIIMDDADLDRAAQLVAASSRSFAKQPPPVRRWLREGLVSAHCTRRQYSRTSRRPCESVATSCSVRPWP